MAESPKLRYGFLDLAKLASYINNVLHENNGDVQLAQLGAGEDVYFSIT